MKRRFSADGTQLAMPMECFVSFTLIGSEKFELLPLGFTSGCAGKEINKTGFEDMIGGSRLFAQMRTARTQFFHRRTLLSPSLFSRADLRSPQCRGGFYVEFTKRQ